MILNYLDLDQLTESIDGEEKRGCQPGLGSQATIMTSALAHAQNLIRLRSVTPSEGGALRYLEKELEAAGFTCHRLPFSERGTPDVDNLYARIGEGRRMSVLRGISMSSLQAMKAHGAIRHSPPRSMTARFTGAAPWT